jgi:hypothetical protein
MPQSIPAGLTKAHILRALEDLDAGIEHPFGQPTDYFLVHEGRLYAPKAVVGLAFRYSIGRALTADESSGGEAPGQANFVLRKLGFAVIKKNDEEEQEAHAGKDWTENEVRLTVADYFDMLEAELLGRAYKNQITAKPWRRSWLVDPMGPSRSSTRTLAAYWSNSAYPTSRAISHERIIRGCSPRRLKSFWMSTLVF